MTTQLNTLISLRQIDVDRAQAQLAELQLQERDLLLRLTGLCHHVEAQRIELATLTRAGRLNIDALRLRRQYLQQLEIQRSDLDAKVAANKLDTLRCRERLVSADQRLQVAKKLRERALATERRQDLKQEALENEEAWRAR